MTSNRIPDIITCPVDIPTGKEIKHVSIETSCVGDVSQTTIRFDLVDNPGSPHSAWVSNGVTSGGEEIHEPRNTPEFPLPPTPPRARLRHVAVLIEDDRLQDEDNPILCHKGSGLVVRFNELYTPVHTVKMRQTFPGQYVVVPAEHLRHLAGRISRSWGKHLVSISRSEHIAEITNAVAELVTLSETGDDLLPREQGVFLSPGDSVELRQVLSWASMLSSGGDTARIARLMSVLEQVG